MSDPPAYQLLPTTDSDSTLKVTPSPNRRRSVTLEQKKLLIHICAIAAIMYAAISGLRHFSRSQLKMGAPCHRKSSVNATGLPSHFSLPSGDKIPAVALGVWQASGSQVATAIKSALTAGYRHIDGALIYGNEVEVGKAIKESSVPREDIWLTSKLWNSFHAPEDVEAALDRSLSDLGTEYLDLYLIHWPVAFNKDGKGYNKALTADPYPTWQKLEEMVEKGKIRNIGISNFNIRRMINLTANPLKIQPAVNQVELHLWNPQPELLKWSKEHGILLEAYSPLGSNSHVRDSLSVPEVKEIASELGVTPAQVIISWHVQRGTVVLPKSVTPSRIKENFQLFTLPQDAFDKIEHAATAHKPKRFMNPSKSFGLDFDIFDDDY